MAPIRLALFGSGIFARDSHLPALKALGSTFEIVAIYSRNQETAAALAATLPTGVEIYSDPSTLLARSDIDAVNIILPIPLQPAMVEAALKAGKHVISEKPIAPDVATGRKLIETAAQITRGNGRVWMIAENLRYEDAIRTAGEIIKRGEIGKPIQFSWITNENQGPQNKFYHTAWRRDNSFPGGFLLDGGVHDIAAMRTIMGEVESLAAFVTQVREDLPPTDTLSATLRFDSGAFGNFTKTFAAGAPWESFIQVLGSTGNLRVNLKSLEVTSNGKTTTQAFNVDAIKAELADFAHVIAQGGPLKSSPEQALQDVAIIEAMLNSGRTGQVVKPERIV
jgi:predicted dehydrogenase